MQELDTALPELQLIKPNVKRDAPLGVHWLEGKDGRITIGLMGSSDENNQPSTLKAEQARVRGFITSKDQLTWMLRYKNTVIGAIWLDILPTEYLPAPAVHIMIGDPAVRGKGVGKNAIQAVISFTASEDTYSTIYSRYLTRNKAAQSLFRGLAFEKLGVPYTDDDRLEWQNVSFDLG